MGKSRAAVPANTDPYLPSPRLFQPPLAGIEPVADALGGLVGKNSAVFEPGIHYHRMPVKSCGCTAVGAGGEKSRRGAGRRSVRPVNRVRGCLRGFCGVDCLGEWIVIPIGVYSLKGTCVE